MTRSQVRRQLSLVFAMLVISSLAASAPAWAQAGDEWSFVITPQVWVSHVALNGFSPPSKFYGFFPSDASGRLVSPLVKTSSSPVDDLNPQWGLQIAAQKGRWTLAGSFQYVNFETRNDLINSPPNGYRFPLGGTPGTICFAGVCIKSGERYAQEFVTTTRLDMDFAASYLFPDVVKDSLDFSLGGGVKVIYASASREFGNMSGLAGQVAAGGPGQTGLYLVCAQNSYVTFTSQAVRCNGAFRDRVKTFDWIYGVTVPTSVILHPTKDAKWLLPLSITPFLGADTRDDRGVVYKINEDGRTKRIDGTTFAYGVTADMTIRYIVNDSLSLYGGMRVQYIEGHEKYLAYGPLAGMSVRFGGK